MRKSFVLMAVGLTLVGTSIAPALAKKGERGGARKPLGTVATFDGSTLSVTKADGTSWSGPVACDLKVKLEHRGDHSRGRGHGNPSRGSAEDLQPGAWVLKMKLDEGVVEKVSIRPAAASTEEEDTTTEEAATSGPTCESDDPDGATTDDEDDDPEEIFVTG